MKEKTKNLIILSVIAVGVVVFDYISKLLVLNNMSLGEKIELIPGVLRLTYIQNRGAAFGMLANNRWVFMALSSVAIVAIGVYLFGFCRERMLFKVGCAMIIGGGVGNMIDRIFYGFVVDMIDFYLFDFWMWIFNIADAAVCVGAGIVILSIILDIVKDRKSKNENK